MRNNEINEYPGKIDNRQVLDTLFLMFTLESNLKFSSKLNRHMLKYHEKLKEQKLEEAK